MPLLDGETMKNLKISADTTVMKFQKEVPLNLKLEF